MRIIANLKCHLLADQQELLASRTCFDPFCPLLPWFIRRCDFSRFRKSRLVTMHQRLLLICFFPPAAIANWCFYKLVAHMANSSWAIIRTWPQSASFLLGVFLQKAWKAFGIWMFLSLFWKEMQTGLVHPLFPGYQQKTENTWQW